MRPRGGSRGQRAAGQGDKRRAAAWPGTKLGQPSGPGHAGRAAHGRVVVRAACAPQPGSRWTLPPRPAGRAAGGAAPGPGVSGPRLVFQNYTQYIPLSVYDLQTWMGSPSIFVYDCSNAGLIVKSFKQFALQREQELEVRLPGAPRAVLRAPLLWAELRRVRCGGGPGRGPGGPRGTGLGCSVPSLHPASCQVCALTT